MKEFAQYLKHKQMIVWIIVVVIVIVAIYFFARKIANKKVEGENELDLDIDQNNLSIDDNEAVIIANNLLGAMNQYGTDEQTIFDNLTGLNKYDLLLVIKKFGVKPYNGTSLASNWIDRNIFSPEKNLIAWLKSELDGADLKKVKEIFDAAGVPF